MIEQLKSRIVDIEKALQDVVGNHTALSVRLDECKYLLDVAVKAAEIIAPANPVVEVLEAVDNVVDSLGSPEEHQ